MKARERERERDTHTHTQAMKSYIDQSFKLLSISMTKKDRDERGVLLWQYKPLYPRRQIHSGWPL